MKKTKKTLSLILALALCVSLCALSASAASLGVKINATLSKTELTAGSSDQTVTLTIAPASTIKADGVGMEIYCSAGLKITEIDSGLKGSDHNITSDTGAMFYWGSGDAEEKSVTSIVTVKITVPANTKAGTYEVGYKQLQITHDYGTEYDDAKSLSGKVSLTVKSASNPSGPSKPAETYPVSTGFVDVSANDYFRDAVNWASKKGITTGTDATHFSPYGICSRAQAVTFLWRAAGSPAPGTAKMPFTDVPATAYYYKAVLWAVENGVTTGTSATTFEPNLSCSRAQIVTFLWRSRKSPAAGNKNPFSDVASGEYYTSAVLWAVKAGVTTGTTATTFEPAANCTRSQIVTFIYRCMG